MGKILKQGKWAMLMLALALWCTGCSDHDGSSASSSNLPGFPHTPNSEIEARIKALEKLLSEDTYNEITKESRNNPNCREDNRAELGLSDEPNGQWYYTYKNLIRGMAEWDKFAGEGDENTRKLEIAAFLANIAQETGAGKELDPTFGGPGCFIQEGRGTYRRDCGYGGCTAQGIGYSGRGPHQLSWDVNYKAFGVDMGEGDKYLKDPDLLTKDPRIGIAGSIWFWGHADLGARDDPEKPFKPSAHDVIVGNWKPTEKDKACGRTEANFGVIINIINGGIECCKCLFYDQDLDKAKTEAEKCCDQGCLKCDWEKDGVCQGWRCCDSIDCISEECKAPKDQAKNRVKYFQNIAEAMEVTIPAGFDVDDDCSGQLNFAHCQSY